MIYGGLLMGISAMMKFVRITKDIFRKSLVTNCLDQLRRFFNRIHLEGIHFVYLLYKCPLPSVGQTEAFIYPKVD